MSILIRPLCVRVAKPCFPCLPRYHRQTPACSCRQSETHRDSRKRQCFTPQMESMLTEAESYCPTSVDGHFSLAKILVITVRTAHSQIAPTANKPQCYNTADMQQSTNVHDVYHGFKIQAQGQRGIRTEQDTSTCFGTKRQTATQEKTHANQRGMVSREVVGQNRNYWNNPTFFCIFSEKGAYLHLTGPNHTGHPVCSQIVLKCRNLARVGRPDILWSVNKLARSITKWTKACDKRLNRLISNIHHTCEYRQYCHLGNTAKQCRLGLFQDFDFAGDLEDSKSTTGRTLCIFGSPTIVPMSWMCKKQTSVSHSSTESEIISLDTGLRLDRLVTLELWGLIVSVFGSVSHVSDRSGQPDSDVKKHHKSQKNIDVMKDIDAVPSNVQSSRQEALLYVFEDNEAVIKMIIKGRALQ